MRKFCQECGSHVFAQIQDFPDIVTLRAGTLDDFNAFKPEFSVWTRSASRSCVLPSEVPAFLEEAPLDVVMGSGIS